MSPSREFFVFVVMPFEERFSDVYEVGIKPACADAGARCERVDEQIFLENILARIYDQIRQADVVVAEVTDRTPNVFYEVGYAHGLGKRVILLTQRAEDIPFDLVHYPHIVYGDRIATLKRSLEEKVRWCIQNPVAAPLVMNSDEVRFAKMTKHIINRLVANEWTKISFRKVREDINVNYTDELLLDLIDNSPDTFRRVKMMTGPGIALVPKYVLTSGSPAVDA